jgi:hypothetical protein
MTLNTFRLLVPRVQLTFALMRGTYLANRWQEEDKFMLYYLPDGPRGFFIEIGYDAHDGQAMVLRSFTSAVLLGDYTQRIMLPEDL